MTHPKKEGLEGEPKSRRSWLKGLPAHVAASAGAAALTTEVMARSVRALLASGNKEGGGSEYVAGATAVLHAVPTGVTALRGLMKDIDGRHRVENDVEIRNLGVVHTLQSFRKNRARFLEAMQEADILCMEKMDTYSNAWAELTREEGKEVVYVDNFADSAVILAIAASASAALLDLENIKKHHELQSRKTIGGWVRRAVCSLFLGTQSPTQGVSPLVDVSYITDARSVKMLDGALDVAKNSQGKKILFVSGNLHAQAVEYYLLHPDVFKAKKKLYEQTYSRLFP